MWKYLLPTIKYLFRGTDKIGLKGRGLVRGVGGGGTATFCGCRVGFYDGVTFAPHKNLISPLSTDPVYVYLPCPQDGCRKPPHTHRQPHYPPIKWVGWGEGG
jgi:hypothetical protein